MKHLFALILLAVFAGPVHGQVYPLEYTQQKCYPTHCEFITHKGSAVCIGKVPGWNAKWVYLTAAHNITNGVVPNVWDGVAWCPAKVLDIDRDKDLALLGVQSFQAIPSVAVAGEKLAAETDVEYFAYLHARTAMRERVKVSKTKWNPPHLFSVKRTAIVSNSGGGILYQGRLYGLIVATDESLGETLCVDGPTIVAWLAKNSRDAVPTNPPASAVAHPPADHTPESTGQPSEVEDTKPEVKPVNPIPKSPPVIAEKPQQPADSKSGFDWWKIASIAAATGLGVATGGGSVYLMLARAAAPIAVGAAKHVVSDISEKRKKRTTQSVPVASPVKPTAEETRIVVPASKPKSTNIYHSEFVPVDDGSYRAAHEFAVTTLGRRYPNQINIFDAERSLIDQYLAGKT